MSDRYGIEAVIFDWAGTTVDYGCFAPVNAFDEAFKEFNIEPTMEEIRKPMGMLKIDHIKTMLEFERIMMAWYKEYGRAYDDEDVKNIYGAFERKLLEGLKKFSAPKPGVVELTGYLRENGIKIGSTTGYNDKMMEIVKPAAAELGYEPDFCITPDSTGGLGRPYPYMIFENMKAFGIRSVRKVVKAGDTVSDILEGKNAGVWSVGVIEGSSELGLTEDEFLNLSENERKSQRERVRNSFFEAGADFVVERISDIKYLVESL